MTVNITISGATAAEAMAEFEDLAAAFFAGRVASATEARVIEAEAQRAEPIAAVEVERAERAAENAKGGKRTRRKAEAAEERQISSQPEMRVDPAEEAQDEADEAEESAAAAADLTHDDVRQALGAYAKAYGMPSAMEDGPKLINAAKVSDIPDTQDALSAAVKAISEAISANPFKRAKEAA